MDEDIQQLLKSGDIPLLSPEEMRKLAERMKITADQYWGKDVKVSVEIAEKIIEIGRFYAAQDVIALGMMARGDALKLLRRTQEAWDSLEEAGHLFLEVHNLVGWARTRIGRLFICIDLNQPDTALKEAETARQILIQHEKWDRLFMLEMNVGIVHDLQGKFKTALQHYYLAQDYAPKLENVKARYLSMLYVNMGFAFQGLNQLREALAIYQQSQALMDELGDYAGLALVNLNIASVLQSQGKYRQALLILHQVLDEIKARLPSEAPAALRTMAECYLALGRYHDACDLIYRITADYPNAHHDIVWGLLHLSTVQTELGLLDEAQSALNKAESTLSVMGSDTWAANLRLRRGQLYLKRGDYEAAYHEATTALAFFSPPQLHYAAARLLQAQAARMEGRFDEAVSAGTEALHIAQHTRMPALRYNTHLHLGHVSMQQKQHQRAIRHYQAAVMTVEKVQRGLTMTLRPTFMENQQEALHSLITLHLKEGNNAAAFELLERAKAQVWMRHITHRDDLRWPSDHPQVQPLLDDLHRLREEHHSFFRLSYDTVYREKHRISSPTPEQALTELHIRERQMRGLMEKLYLYSHHDIQTQMKIPTLRQIQDALDEETLVIEFYDSGQELWVFTLNRSGLTVTPLETPSCVIYESIDQLQSNISRALRAGADSPATNQLTSRLKHISQRLYSALLQPIEHQLMRHPKIKIVPYGTLHYLPFHLLYTGNHHLIEWHQLTILPAASLILQEQANAMNTGDSLVLACSSHGLVPQVISEAQMIHEMVGGHLHLEGGRTVLDQPPGKILHIAAHGQFRIDQPDFSYIELCDGQVFADDLFQRDLSYELVVLSACETGRFNAVGAEDLIGLGRGFLFAGAGALIASLWRVEDTRTADMMKTLYGFLLLGRSKAQALQHMMKEQLVQQPDLHPAFWGAFQLIGSASPLSRQ